MDTGLREVVGTPVEGAFSGDEMAYAGKGNNDNNLVDEVIALKK